MINLSESYTVRRMTAEDAPFFNRVRNFSRIYLHDSSEYSVSDSINWILKTSPIFYILSFEDEDIGYFRTSNWENDTVYIGMDLDPEKIGKGHAQKSYLLFMDYLANEYGIKIFYLRVLKSNDRARHIYSKLGFEIIEETKVDLKMGLKR